MAYISFEKYGPEYLKLWDTMKIIRDATELQRLSDKIKLNKEPYLKVEKATGVPWQMVAVMHVREAGEQDIGVWKRCLHNGERIIGTGRKTKLVPAGRGPFTTWHDAAVDAIQIKGFQKIARWPVERVLWALEPFNGYGYRNRGLRSPYLWASTNHQQPGKFVADHVFDATVMDKQIGCAALLKYLEFGKKTGIAPTVVTGVTLGTAATVAEQYGYGTWIPVGIALAVAIVIAGVIVWRIRRKNKINVEHN